MVKYAPKHGDIVWLDFDPQAGKEIQKIRPALTISVYEYNVKTGLALFMPITSQIKGYPFEVLVNLDLLKGAILCDQIRSLDWKARKAKFIAAIPKSILEEAMEKFAVLLPT